MKEKLKKMLTEKKAQQENLRSALIEGETKEERAEIGKTLAAIGKEIADLEAMIDEIDEPAGDGGDGAGARSFTHAATVATRSADDTTKANAEFRKAWLNSMQGKALTEEEKRSIASADVVIPVETQNSVISKIKEFVPLLDEIQLLNVAGSVKFAVEGTMNDAAIHAENASIDAAADKLVTIQLDGYEIVKLVRISATVKTMTTDAFENWLVEQLARKVAEMIEYYIINGNGSGQPKGIAHATTWNSENAVAWAGTAPTANEIMSMIGMLASRHARVAKFLMNRKTFWANVMPLRDDKKMPIVAGEGAGAYNVFGYPVLLSDFVNDGEIYFGNMRMVVGNLSNDIAVDSSAASGFAHNAIDYRGAAIFDCDVADAEAFVKSAKTIA